MRKPISFLFVFSFLLLAACNKKDDAPAFSYIINNIQNVPLSIAGVNTLPLEIKYVSGNQEPVSLSATGLPAGVTASFSAASGTPTFSTVLTFTASTTAAEGTYPIKIIGTSASTGTKSYDLELVISGYDMSTYLLGTWNLTGEGEDVNQNNVIDPGEVSAPIDPSTLTFLSNGQCKISISSFLFEFLWSLADNQKTLMLSLEGDISKAIIHTVTTNSVVLRSDEASPASWTVLTR